MLRIVIICCVAAVALAGATTIAGSDTTSTIPDPESYSVGTPPDSVIGRSAPKAAVEKASALVGINYAVISQAIDSKNGTNSYIRLFNGGSLPALFTIAIVDSSTGQQVGAPEVANIMIPARASQQRVLGDIIKLVKTGVPSGGTYALYIQASEATAGYQHVSYNAGTDLFENVSVCNLLLNQVTAVVSNSIVMTNLHTSLIEGLGYPTQIEIHNFADVPKTYRFTVTNAWTGSIKGYVDLPTQANTSYVLPFISTLQHAASVNWTSTDFSTETHANVIITDTAGGKPNATVGQSVIVAKNNGTSNMSMACAVRQTVPASGGGVVDPFSGNGAY